MGNSIAAIRSAESKALEHGSLTTKDAQAIAKLATTPEEKAVVADIFSHDAFEKSVDKSKLPSLVGMKTLPPSDKLAGTPVAGQKGVFVQKTLGDSAGYESKNHAIAVARAVGSDRAMVVQDSKKQWHAVETNVPGTTSKTAVFVGKVDQKQYDALRAAAQKNNDPEKWKDFASFALGVPRDEINVIGKDGKPLPNKVNINLSPDFDAEGRTSVFDPKKPETIQLGPLAFDNPANAVSTLAHEEVHAKHSRMTAPRYAAYQADTKKGKDDFRTWNAKNSHPKTLEGWRDVEIINGEMDGSHAGTELMAHFEASKVSASSGNLAQLKIDLQKLNTLDALPTPQAQIATEKEIKAFRDSLPADQRAVFDEVAKTAGRNSILKGM